MDDMKKKKMKKLLAGMLRQPFDGGSARYTGYCGVCNEEIIGFSDVGIKEAQKDCLEKLKEHVEDKHLGGRKWMEEFEKLVGTLEDKPSVGVFEQVRKVQE